MHRISVVQMHKIVVINGPNLNLLGSREPEVYGTTTLTELEAEVVKWGTERGLDIEVFQSNHEGRVIDRLHEAGAKADGVVLNPGAFTHYSYAIHDAIAAIEIPTVEVHISNVMAREEWRRRSVVRPACVYTIFGRGIRGYQDALEHLLWRDASPPLTLPYGAESDQVADLRVPTGDGPHPVAIVLHGGLWRDIWTRDLMDGVAADLAGHGWASWNTEYRRVGTGGGWPASVEDVEAAIDALAGVAEEHNLDLSQVIAVGHSAGGQLALAAAKRRSLPSVGTGSQVTIAGVIAVAPMADLESATSRQVGAERISDFLRGADGESAAYTEASPATMIPLGVRQVVIHGSGDDLVPVDLSASYSAAAADAGDSIVYHEPKGADHYDLFDANSETRRLVLAELERLRSE